MTFLTVASTAFSYFFSLLWTWLLIFAAPFAQPNMLWIIIPIYINWIFTDFFQERKGTSLGNAITNGAVVFWVSIDWSRTIVNNWPGFSTAIIIKFMIIFLTFIYGLIIIVQGIRGRDFVAKFGRVREVTYVLLMFTPVIYDQLQLTFENILAMIIFAPIFYYLMEFIDQKILPKSKVLAKLEEEEATLEKFQNQPLA